MPQKNKTSTLLRQWEMMRMLTVSRVDTRQDGRWDKASDIAARLNESGYKVSVRTVQRDLKALSEIFPIELNDNNPRDFGWRWPRGTHLDIPGMSIPEALAMRLVETHISQLLPASMLDGLQGVFNLAHHKLDQAGKKNDNHSKNWLDKVRVVPPAQPLLAPIVREDVQAGIYQALLEDRQITAEYQSMNSEQPRECVLHPLGLIMRGALAYLVASAWAYADARLYALHRFSRVEILDAAVNTPEEFNLDKAIASGLAEFANQGEPIHLELRCTNQVAAYLAETPLATDQKIEAQADGWVRLTATVNDTWQLQWWILAQGVGMEVCGPHALRSSIMALMQKTLGNYTTSLPELQPTDMPA